MDEDAVRVGVVVGVAGKVVAAVNDQHFAASAGQPFGDNRAGKTGSYDQGINSHGAPVISSQLSVHSYQLSVKNR
jgi:hypothetical protein